MSAIPTNLQQMIDGFPSIGPPSSQASHPGLSTGANVASSSAQSTKSVLATVLPCDPVNDCFDAVDAAPTLAIHTATFASTAARNIPVATCISSTRVKPVISVSSNRKLRPTAMKHTINLFVYHLDLYSLIADVAENVVDILQEHHITCE